MNVPTRSSDSRASSSLVSEIGATSRAAGSSEVPGRNVLHAKKPNLRSGTSRCAKLRNGEAAKASQSKEDGSPNGSGQELRRRGNAASPGLSVQSAAARPSETLSGGRKGQGTHAAKLLTDLGNLSRRERPKADFSGKGSDAKLALAQSKGAFLKPVSDRKQASSLVSSGQFCFLASGPGSVYTPKQKKPGQSQAAKTAVGGAPAASLAQKSAADAFFPGSFSQPELRGDPPPEESEIERGDARENLLPGQKGPSVDASPHARPCRTGSLRSACGGASTLLDPARPQESLPSRDPQSTESASSPSSPLSSRTAARLPGVASASSFSSSASSLSSSFASSASSLSSSSCGYSPCRSVFHLRRSSTSVFSPPRSPFSPFSFRTHGSAVSPDGSPSSSAPLLPEMFLNFVDSAFLIFPPSRDKARAAAEEMLRAADREAEREEGEKVAAARGQPEDENGEGEKAREEPARGEAKGNKENGETEDTEREGHSAKRRKVLGSTNKDEKDKSQSTDRTRSDAAENGAAAGRGDTDETREGETEQRTDSSPFASKQTGVPGERGSTTVQDSRHHVSQDLNNSPFSSASPLRHDPRTQSAYASRVFPAWPGDEAPASPVSSVSSSPIHSPPSSWRGWCKRRRTDARALKDCLREEGERLSETVKKRDLMHLLRSTSLELPHPNRHGVSLIYGPRVPGDDGFDYRVVYWGETAASVPEEKVRNQMRAQAFRERIRNLAHQSPDGMLTVQQLVLDLDINMSRGWTHYGKVILAGKNDPYTEFLLRRPRNDSSSSSSSS